MGMKNIIGNLTVDGNLVINDELTVNGSKVITEDSLAGQLPELNASDLSGAGYLNTHPENGATLIPFIHNDLAFLTQKGGTCTIYSTTSTDFTVATLAQTSLAVSNPERMFDGTPSYCIITTTGAFTAVVDLVLPKLFSYSNQFYIDFGATAWYAKSISVYAMNSANETAYTLKASTTTNTKGNWFAEFSHTSGSNVSGFNCLRIVIKDFRNTTSSSGKRISQLGLINYNSNGVSETYISRGGCEGVYGSLIPQTNNAVNLGSSSKKWKTIHGTTIYQNGNQVANKSDVTTIFGNTGAVVPVVVALNSKAPADPIAGDHFTFTIYTTLSSIPGYTNTADRTKSNWYIWLCKLFHNNNIRMYNFSAKNPWFYPANGRVLVSSTPRQVVGVVARDGDSATYQNLCPVYQFGEAFEYFSYKLMKVSDIYSITIAGVGTVTA